MSQAREIRNKIASVKNTQKITRAMELVAASKMRKAQDRMTVSRPYSRKIRKVIRHIAASHAEYRHPYMAERTEIKREGYIVVTTDRGLCGGLNVNLFRALLKELKVKQDAGVEISLCIIGKKGRAFFHRFGGNIIGLAESLGDAPDVGNVVGVVKVMLDHFKEEKVDVVHVVANEFINSMVQKPFIRQLLPLPKGKEEETEKGYWDYIYEPDSAKELLEQLLIRYIESQVYQAVVENIACEQSARMVAMKSATENAGSLIKELRLIYNKARQAGITREISEIVGGAAAVG